MDDLLNDKSNEGTGSFESDDSSQPFYVKEESEKDSDDFGDRTLNLANNPARKLNAKVPPTPDADEVSRGPSTVVATNRFKKEQPNDNEINKSFSRRPVNGRESSMAVSSPHEMSLVQSENLRVAQQRILDLEEEISRLRLENEELAAAADTLRKLVEELKGQLERLQTKYNDSSESYKTEKELLLRTATAKDKMASELKHKVAELETRLTANIHKIRNRERELENRLELIKIESQALVRSKDELTLELKRQIDQLRLEIENYRNKSQELKKRSDDKQEILRRTVKTLRLALTMLEGEEDGSDGNNKAS